MPNPVFGRLDFTRSGGAAPFRGGSWTVPSSARNQGIAMESLPGLTHVDAPPAGTESEVASPDLHVGAPAVLYPHPAPSAPLVPPAPRFRPRPISAIRR